MKTSNLEVESRVENDCGRAIRKRRMPENFEAPLHDRNSHSRLKTQSGTSNASARLFP